MNIPALLLKQLTAHLNAPNWWVALSGGLDSVVLLKALSELRKTQAIPKLQAIHIHHGLQEAANQWPAFCQQLCNMWDISLQVHYVQVALESSLEQAARNARYDVFAHLLEDDDCLITAHHLNDQVETLLFRAVRGSGVLGMTGMSSCRSLGKGYLLRPLLECPRTQLEAYAHQQQLIWVDDPTNSDLEYDRNYMRQQIIPALQQRWPQSLTSLQRMAQHMQQAQSLLDELAREDIQSAQAQPITWLSIPCLDLSVLSKLSTTRQQNALRYWLRPYTQLPDTAHWAGWISLRDAKNDAEPCWQLAAGQLVRFSHFIFWLSGDWLKQPVLNQEILPLNEQRLALVDNGYLNLEGSFDITKVYRVAYRQGGEVIALKGRGRRDLKRVLQEVKLPIFARHRVPLLFENDQLIAIANFPALICTQEQPVRLTWLPPKANKQQ